MGYAARRSRREHSHGRKRTDARPASSWLRRLEERSWAGARDPVASTGHLLSAAEKEALVRKELPDIRVKYQRQRAHSDSAREHRREFGELHRRRCSIRLGV